MSIPKITRITPAIADMNRAKSLIHSGKVMGQTQAKNLEEIDALFKKMRAGTLDEKSKEKLVLLCINRVGNMVKNAYSKLPNQYQDEFKNIPYDVFRTIEQIINKTKKTGISADDIRDFGLYYIKSVSLRLKRQFNMLQKSLVHHHNTSDFEYLTASPFRESINGTSPYNGQASKLTPDKLLSAKEELENVIAGSKTLSKKHQKLLEHILKTGSCEFVPGLGFKKKTSWRSALHYLRTYLANYRNQ